MTTSLLDRSKSIQRETYRHAGLAQQELLRTGTPLEIAKALDRVCPFCGNYLIPRIEQVRFTRPPRQIPVFPDHCGCLAEREAMSAEADRRNKILSKQEQIAWRSALQNAGMIGWLARATFDNYKERKEWPGAALAKGCVEDYTDALIAGKLGEKPWLILHGDGGCGKSHLAAAVCLEAMGRGLDRVFFRPWGQYLDQLMATFDRERGEPRTVDLLNELQHGRIVVIDDLDKVPTKPWAESKLFTVLNHRYNATLPTIVTLNTSPDNMTGPIADRMRGAAWDCILFDGPSFRFA